MNRSAIVYKQHRGYVNDLKVVVSLRVFFGEWRIPSDLQGATISRCELQGCKKRVRWWMCETQTRKTGFGEKFYPP